MHQKIHQNLNQQGGVSERPKEHAWKACIRDKRIVGSNPTSSEFFCRLEILVLIIYPENFKNELCPFCGNEESKVTDSRNASETNAIRRRRECLQCGRRFTTFETVDISMQIKKRDGSYEDFSMDKLIKGLDAASRHTRISHDQVRDLASSIVNELIERQVREIDTTTLGQIAMEKLRDLDTVAYIRFACVYRRFKDVDEIMNALNTAAPEEAKK